MWPKHTNSFVTIKLWPFLSYSQKFWPSHPWREHYDQFSHCLCMYSPSQPARADALTEKKDGFSKNDQNWLIGSELNLEEKRVSRIFKDTFALTTHWDYIITPSGVSYTLLSDHNCNTTWRREYFPKMVYMILDYRDDMETASCNYGLTDKSEYSRPMVTNIFKRNLTETDWVLASKCYDKNTNSVKQCQSIAMGRTKDLLVRMKFCKDTSLQLIVFDGFQTTFCQKWSDGIIMDSNQKCNKL